MIARSSSTTPTTRGAAAAYLWFARSLSLLSCTVTSSCNSSAGRAAFSSRVVGRSRPSTAPVLCHQFLKSRSTKPGSAMAHDQGSVPHRFVDIGANILDDRYQGNYRGTQRHEPDLHLAIKRAQNVGVRHIVVTAGTVEESRRAVEFCREWNQKSTGIHFSSTVGVHPTRCQQEFLDKTDIDDDAILNQLVDIAIEGKKDGTVVAVGEIGLDYDRLDFTAKDAQHKYLIRQLQVLAKAAELPLFLHNRNVGSDLYDILLANKDCWPKGGVVHSFDDTVELASKFIETGSLYIGLNGCSLRTEENLQTVAQLPLNRLLVETDCPYCDVRKTHAGYSHIKTTFDAKPEKKFVMGHPVKNRQEPCHVIQVAEIVAGVQEKSLAVVADTTYQNSLDLFGWVDE